MELTFNVVTAGVQLLPVKSRILNQLPVVIVGIAEPLFIVKLGAVVVVPPVVPNVNVRVIPESDTNPPVTNEQLKLVASATERTVEAAVGVDNIMLLEPNITERVSTPDELNVPIVKLAPPKFKVPATTKQTEVVVYV